MSRVLVIEDDALLRRTIERALTLHGHEVICAEDGAAGVAAWHREKPDVVITDLYMPNVDGIEAIRALRIAGATIPIIAVSGGDSHRSLLALESAGDLGATRLLPKPFTPSQLAAVVAETLGP
jgi:CheY-like chemotaxis protein